MAGLSRFPCVAGNQVRLRWPPKTAPSEGRPKGADAPMPQSREADCAAWPLHSPEGRTELARRAQGARPWVGHRTLLRDWPPGGDSGYPPAAAGPLDPVDH